MIQKLSAKCLLYKNQKSIIISGQNCYTKRLFQTFFFIPSGCSGRQQAQRKTKDQINLQQIEAVFGSNPYQSAGIGSIGGEQGISYIMQPQNLLR